MRLTLFFVIFAFSSSCFATEFPFISVKERLRLHLWSSGVTEFTVKEAKKRPKVLILPEEIERPLQKL